MAAKYFRLRLMIRKLWIIMIDSIFYLLIYWFYKQNHLSVTQHHRHWWGFANSLAYCCVPKFCSQHLSAVETYSSAKDRNLEIWIELKVSLLFRPAALAGWADWRVCNIGLCVALSPVKAIHSNLLHVRSIWPSFCFLLLMPIWSKTNEFH